MTKSIEEVDGGKGSREAEEGELEVGGRLKAGRKRGV